MPFALLIIGAFLLIAAVRGTTEGPNGLFALVAGEFQGPTNFIYWMTAILLIGALGYIPKAKPISTALLGLVVVVLFLKKGDSSSIGGGFFQQFTAGLQSTTNPPANVPTAAQNATAASQTLAPGQTGTQSVIQQSIGAMQSGATPGGSSLDNTISILQNEFGGWIN